MTEKLLSRAAKAIKVFTGHDSDVNLRYVYGDRWWEPLEDLRRELELELQRKDPMEDIYIHRDHQTGKWIVEEEPPKVIRTGAQVIHAKIVTRDLYKESEPEEEEPFAWRWEFKPEQRHGVNAVQKWYTTMTPPDEQDLLFKNYEPLYTESDLKKKVEERHNAFMNS